ncbi:MAG: thioredoxin family protein [Pseudomonadota bacterium]|jgi:thiol-disulfide isomerase/thioredoxin|nr:thioredoxin family protein [Pseudomonadota bacterium]MEC8042035.1 thioredoxin family protein [Pseudomonadota bacterium]MEC8292055.1 thioredoxin family protein [Pseudomonadota bacterium]
MKRRDFMALGAAAVLSAGAAWAEPLDYTEGLAKAHLAKGEVVFLDFKADWCSTCAAQERAITALMAENPEYAEKITFINVDWDQFGRSDLVKELRIPRRSTLVALQGDAEIGRIVADTKKSTIKALMDQALAASS